MLSRKRVGGFDPPSIYQCLLEGTENKRYLKRVSFIFPTVIRDICSLAFLGTCH